MLNIEGKFAHGQPRQRAGTSETDCATQPIDRFQLTRAQFDEGYLRVAGIVAPKGLLPIGRSTWHEWVAKGKVAAGIKLSPGVTVWPRAYIANLVLTLQQGGE
ncbi:helix-turn-helix transcriptional regulator [Ancylobacter vacuolatus]|uniref:Transcriptional regulator, AlpA family n=1 Tax=Ancylobacter vacuolatus TaxID=223389 RepID=A0ABU0DM68_9HYPH|nr:hypothetical protein [Ancylobacter vacuolatus]MDQ0349408.1 hypothetical protein [Ancylobacter vacuolatus]